MFIENNINLIEINIDFDHIINCNDLINQFNND